jgi:hypothetical protein
MNERIRELAKQANGPNPFYGTLKNQMTLLGDDAVEKFAELVVRECCDWIDGSPSTDAGQLLLTKSFIIANLKGHFVVES